MSEHPVGWCPICELSLQLVEPWEQNPLLCRQCAESLIGTLVCCPRCRRRHHMIDETITRIEVWKLAHSHFVMDCPSRHDIPLRFLKSAASVPPEKYRPGMKLMPAE